MSAHYIPSPLGMEFRPWANIFAEQYADVGVSAPDAGMSWQDWACSLLNFQQLVSLPEPYGFNDWQDWAVRTLETNIN